MRKIIESIRNKPEDARRRAALGMSLVITAIIFAGWLGSKGWIGLPQKNDTRLQTAQVIDAKNVESPIDTSKKALSGAGIEIKSAINDFNESISRVLVPFMTGIEIYERK